VTIQRYDSATVQTVDGPRTVRVIRLAGVDGLIVAEITPDRWTVTHESSGKRATASNYTKADALAVAEAIAPVTAWTNGEAEITIDAERIGSRIAAILLTIFDREVTP